MRSLFGFLMKRVLLLSLLGLTIVSGIILDNHDGRKKQHHRHSFENSASSSSESSERDKHRHRTTVPPKAPCPTDWITFDRPQGRWCVKVFTGNNLDWVGAYTKCFEIGATLTGLQNSTEQMTVAGEGRRLQRLNNLGDASIWLGGTRKSTCPGNNICKPQDTFQWIDRFTTSDAGIQFPANQPDAAHWGNEIQSCIHLFITLNGGNLSGVRDGELDDHWCSSKNAPSYRLYACGKKP